MRARDFLEMVRQQRETIRTKKAALEQARADLYLLKSPSLEERVQNTNLHDLSDAQIRFEEKVEACRAAVLEVEQMETDARALVSILPVPKWKAVLFNRFILDYTWEKVAEDLCIDESYVYRISRQAFEYIEDSPQWRIISAKY